jgi:hypothetical protein
MTNKKEPLIVQMVTISEMDSYNKPFTVLYGLSDTGEVYKFNFGDKVWASEIEERYEMVDQGTYRSKSTYHDRKHIGYKNRGWVKVENFVNAIPKGYELVK